MNLKNRKNQGLFITCEGGEGSGKTTLIHSLEQALLKHGYEVVRTREPGGSALGNQIRECLLHHDFSICTHAELMLFLASRAQHVHELIQPALLASKVVLCDRFNDSTVAYQGIARGLGSDFVQRMCDFVCQDIVPDLTLFLDIDPVEGLNRTKRRMVEADRIESERLEFHQKVRHGLQELAGKYAERIRVIDASQSTDYVFNEAWLHLQVLLSEGFNTETQSHREHRGEKNEREGEDEFA